MRLGCRFILVFSLSFPASAQTPAAPAAPEAKSAAAEKPHADVGKTRKTPKESTAAASGSSAATSASTKPPESEASLNDAPRKIVVRRGGANEPEAQVVPGMTPEEAAIKRQNAEQLLGSSEEQLRQLTGRKLNAQQVETVGQIRNYVSSARTALEQGDVRRAHTVAQKAYLLAEDLTQH